MIAAFVKSLFRRSTEALPFLSDGFFSRPGKVCLGTLFFLILPAFAVAQVTQRGEPSTADAQKCSALAQIKLEDAPGGPAIITSAQLVEVPATGLDQWIVIPSGYGSVAAHIPTRIHEYCDVTGYVYIRA
jgi:hypothetical protein